jgi:acetyl esterase/lipase
MYPPYEQFGGVHSMMEDYARMLAPLGYVCFVIEYRLVPDNPVPDIAPDAEGLQKYELILTDAGIERLTLVRSEMGLSLLTKDDSLILWNGILAGAEDVKKAVDHVRNSADKFGVDSDRIALGGHSAGVGNTLNAAFGLKADVAAIFPMSPAVIGFDMTKVVHSQDLPPMLLLTAQNDLGAVLEGIPGLLTSVRKVGVTHEFVWVPGFAHFYPTGAVSLSSDGTRMSVGQRVVKFLKENLK